jgi:hypothetical protein
MAASDLAYGRRVATPGSSFTCRSAPPAVLTPPAPAGCPRAARSSCRALDCLLKVLRPTSKCAHVLACRCLCAVALCAVAQGNLIKWSCSPRTAAKREQRAQHKRVPPCANTECCMEERTAALHGCTPRSADVAHARSAVPQCGVPSACVIAGLRVTTDGFLTSHPRALTAQPVICWYIDEHPVN